MCFCNKSGVPDCLRVFESNTYPIYPGQTVSVSVVVTGQDFGTVAGSVWANFLTLPHTQSAPVLSVGQVTQGVSQQQCNTLNYTVKLSSEYTGRTQVLALMSTENLVTSFLDKARVEETIRLWKLTFFNKSEPEYALITREVYQFPVFINITVVPCPVGFQLTRRAPHVCDCQPLLQGVPGVECDIQQLTISRQGFVWIGVSHDGNEVMISESCPQGYCTKEKVNMSLDYLDSQCDYRRSGILCGQCRQGLSLILGSSHCQHCSNVNLFLILPFALAGVALVLFIKLLDLTVSQGTINGLILYANVVQANKPVFFTSAASPLALFVAWLNLDVGINTCFFDGLTAYGNTWLQFLFPLYIWGIAGVIILLAKYSDRAARVTGNNSVSSSLMPNSHQPSSESSHTEWSTHPVEARQCGQLMETWITCVEDTYLSLWLVWVLCLPYTLLLFLGPWLQKCDIRFIN